MDHGEGLLLKKLLQPSLALLCFTVTVLDIIFPNPDHN